MLEVKNIKKNYYTENKEINALDNISFKIKKGDYVGIVGPSGAGKSTILSIIGNLEKVTSGQVIKKDDIKLGYMMQEDLLFPWLTIYQNCLLGLKIGKKLTKENENYALNLLKKYGLIEFKNNYPKDLSGGMRQRVSLIRTLTLKPDLILLDEPFSKLDYQNRIKVSKDVLNILKKEKKTLIMVTHDINEAINMCNKIIVISNRPSIVKNIYDVTNDNKLEIYDKIWSDLNE